MGEKAGDVGASAGEGVPLGGHLMDGGHHGLANGFVD